jgi:hypothetical protein
VQAHRDAHHVDRQRVEHAALEGQHRAVGNGAQEVGQVVDVRRVHAAADRDPVADQRAAVDAAADQALDGLVAVDVVELEGALDAGLGEATHMLLEEARRRGHDHVRVGAEAIGLGQRGAGDVLDVHLLDDVHLRGVDGHRHLVGLRVQLGQHVARVVGQPLGGCAVALGGEGDRAADLDDHLGHGLAHAADQLVEHRQALAAAAVEFAHMQVQHGGAGVVAVDRLLDLRLHRDGDVLREVRRNPLRTVRCGGDDELVLVLGEQGSILEVHRVSS